MSRSGNRDSDLLIPIKDDRHEYVQVQSCSFGGILISAVLNLLLMPVLLLPIWASFIVVDPQEEVLMLCWGRLVKRIEQPGIYWWPFIGRSVIRISKRITSIEIHKTTVVDQNGNPIIVSGVVTYKIIDATQAAFAVENVNDYLRKQSLATLKKVCSKYPYESKDGHSLQHEPDTVMRELVSNLQTKADIAGANVLSYELTDLQYAPEIAGGMLVRQQAQALLDARKVVVEGACSIVTSAMIQLAENGVKLTDTEQRRLVTNLLSVICSDARVQPTFSINDQMV